MVIDIGIPDDGNSFTVFEFQDFSASSIIPDAQTLHLPKGMDLDKNHMACWPPMQVYSEKIRKAVVGMASGTVLTQFHSILAKGTEGCLFLNMYGNAITHFLLMKQEILVSNRCIEGKILLSSGLFPNLLNHLFGFEKIMNELAAFIFRQVKTHKKDQPF
ncbi:hypothetical protein CI610_01276 [invertebrate metagenome]|uniref:Uncharacterized protein n=1 Tax=invertebrate metagenome TaxID=1711999 RepID=A0A2H9T931_9ZZZZ